ncbi:hypothetical protein T265_03540 [Opisthorchis viverrini]|uniref:t-SNARE coiled-coil homology domain-containing protein n=1 Tax=Opisthorchis viverrini TaxID=6198 RepID=A0A075AHI7_OPIVI|nr:hypothetical protein T265_03540 [Opisthorchis viverrini]KER29954.1 hypothetical protein T265_03540 [Opisthorchis viverrini]
MATRSLTESFAFMRNNAFQNRQFFSDQKTNDREALVPKSRDDDIEKTSRSRVPQEWQSLVNSVQYTFTLIHQKMKELVALHNRHLMATNLDDNLDEDQEIEQQTKELTEVNILSLAYALKCHRKMKRTQEIFVHGLQLKSRDDRIQGYLSWGPLLENNSTGLDDFGDQEYQLWEAQKQKREMLLEENTAAVAQREHEINQIVRSIYELNEIFRDVAQLVVDQGTLVDRIDYNVENTQIRVEQGLQQLSKAQHYQSKDRKMLVIMVLATLVIVFGILLIVTKFR